MPGTEADAMDEDFTPFDFAVYVVLASPLLAVWGLAMLHPRRTLAWALATAGGEVELVQFLLIGVIGYAAVAAITAKALGWIRLRWFGGDDTPSAVCEPENPQG